MGTNTVKRKTIDIGLSGKYRERSHYYCEEKNKNGFNGQIKDDRDWTEYMWKKTVLSVESASIVMVKHTYNLDY